MNIAGRQIIAEALNARLPSVTVRFGQGNVAPSDADVGLSGAEITSVTAAMTQAEAANAFVANVTFNAATTLNEVGLFQGNGVMFDRFLLGGQSIVAGGRIQVEWELEVV